MKSKILDYIAGDSHHNGVIRIDYSKYALNQTQLIMKNGINDEAIKRTYEEGISIDGIESLDLDDAIRAEKTLKGYSVFVHISDVTEAIKIYSPLDIEALKRTTSIYRQEGVINMVPPELSQNLLSLNENGKKLTLSIRIDLDFDTNIVDFSVYESVFKNKRRHDYESFVEDFVNPDSEDHDVFQLMYEIARKRKNIRKISGANMNFDDSERQLFIGTHEEKIHSSRKKIPSTIIEEFMILANISSAIICAKNGYNSIFRLHKSCDERAFYSNSIGSHAGLALENYTHFTSPIRRYADMVVHRVLKQVHLRNENNPYLSDEISDIAQYINFSRTIIDILGRDANLEMKGKKIVSKLKQKNGENLNTSHFTKNIRETVGNGSKISKIIVEQLLNDLENGHKSNWAWAIGVFLVCKNDEIKKCLKKVLLDDEKFSAKSVISLLNVTKILNTDNDFLFEITEKITKKDFSINVNFKGQRLTKYSMSFGENNSQVEVIGIVRKEILKGILDYFCLE